MLKTYSFVAWPFLSPSCKTHKFVGSIMFLYILTILGHAVSSSKQYSQRVQTCKTGLTICELRGETGRVVRFKYVTDEFLKPRRICFRVYSCNHLSVELQRLVCVLDSLDHAVILEKIHYSKIQKYIITLPRLGTSFWWYICSSVLRYVNTTCRHFFPKARIITARKPMGNYQCLATSTWNPTTLLLGFRVSIRSFLGKPKL